MKALLQIIHIIDGNKRFGYVAMRLLLLESDFDISATEDEKYEFVLNIAKDELKFSGICRLDIKKSIQIKATACQQRV